MDGFDPSILTKPCHLALSKLGIWQNFLKKNIIKGGENNQTSRVLLHHFIA